MLHIFTVCCCYVVVGVVVVVVVVHTCTWEREWGGGLFRPP